MPTDATSPSDLLVRFATLGSADRKAVRARMSQEERTAFEELIAQERLKRKIEAERVLKADRQYIAYSPWLGEIIEKAAIGDEKASEVLTASSIRAIADVHARLRDDEMGQAGSIWSRIQNFLLGPAPSEQSK